MVEFKGETGGKDMVQLAPPTWMRLAFLLDCLSSRELKGAHALCLSVFCLACKCTVFTSVTRGSKKFLSRHWCLNLDLSSIQDNMESTSILNKFPRVRHFGIAMHKCEAGGKNWENWE